MPIEIRDIHDGQGVLITGWGIVRDQEYLESHTEHLTQDPEKFKQYRYSLSDYTKATEVYVLPKSIRTIAELCKKAAAINPVPVVATVTTPGFVYGLARMAELLRDGPSWESMVFDNRDEAEQWIREVVKQKFDIDIVSFD